MRADAWTGEATPPVTFDFFLGPSAPPRSVGPDEALFPFDGAKRCAGEGPPGAVHGRLPPEAIQRIVRSHYGDFRACYERGLGRNSKLTGRVTVRFVIERDGRASNVLIFDNTLPDCKVARCVRDAYPSMKFPTPEGGIVTVVYPIMLEPG